MIFGNLTRRDRDKDSESQPLSQGLSSSGPLKREGGEKSRDPGNEVI